MAELREIVTRIELEMTGDTKFFLVSAKQGDKATRYIVAKLLYGGEEYTIPTEAKAIVNIKKPDGKRVYNTCTHSGAEVTIELTNQALAAAGIAYCDVEIQASDGTQLITSASFTIEVEESMRNDDAIESSNEFTELENRIKDHISAIDSTNEEVKEAEESRVKAEKSRATGEEKRAAAEKERNEKETIRQQQEKEREEASAQAVKNAQDATKITIEATEDCKEITGQAEEALANQQQLEVTLNEVTKMRQDVSQMQETVAKAKEEVEQDKQEIDETIQNSLLASAEKILESVQNYFNRAEALYSSMYLDCDGETPYLRVVTPIVIDGETPQVRVVNEGVDFDGGTPMYRLLTT